MEKLITPDETPVTPQLPTPESCVCSTPTEMNAVAKPTDFAPHLLERQVSRTLAAQPGLAVSNLVVRRVSNGVCLSGVVETCSSDVDVCSLVRQIEGVDEVVNRLLVRSGHTQ